MKILRLAGLSLMAVVAAFGAVQTVAGDTTGAIESLKIFVAIQVGMAFLGAFPPPSMLKTHTKGELSYIWMFNFANILCQNFNRLYHPTTDGKVTEISHMEGTVIRTSGGDESDRSSGLTGDKEKK